MMKSYFQYTNGDFQFRMVHPYETAKSEYFQIFRDGELVESGDYALSEAANIRQTYNEMSDRGDGRAENIEFEDTNSTAKLGTRATKGELQSLLARSKAGIFSNEDNVRLMEIKLDNGVEL